jgi:hypothetical protein
MSDWIEVNEGGEAWDGKEPIQGVYMSSKSNVGPNSSNMYMIKVGDEMKGIWGSAVIDSKFEQISKGSEVRVEFLGKAKSKSGTEYKDYKVQYKPTEASKVVDQFDGAEVL